MEEEHQRISNDEDQKIDLEPTTSVDEVEQDLHDLSITPIPETFHEEIEDEQVETTKSQADENVPQQQQQQEILHSSSLSTAGRQENGSVPNLTETSMMTTTNDERDPPSNHPHTLRENQQISDRSSPINGPGIAKPVGMTSSTTSSKESSSPSSQHRLSSSTNPVGKKRIDAALEKNIETIVTQVRRTTTKPSQLTQNDLQLFDSTAPSTVLKNGHHSRETTPSNSHALQKQSSSSSREMTPDSINADSANEDQQQNVRNGHSHHPYPHAHHPSHPHHPHHSHQQRSARLPTSTVDLTAVPSLSPYGPQGWPPAVYPFAPQHHPGLYLPYPPSATTSSPTNGLPAFYPPYDPLLIEQHYGPQGLSAFYNQQQQQHSSSLSGTHPNANLFRESQSLTDIFNHANKFSALSNVHLTDQQQQQMVLSQLYLNQISSLPFVTLYDPTAASVRAFRSNGDIDHLSSTLTTPTREPGENSPIGSGESIKSSDSITTGHRKKKSSSVSSQQHSSINGSLSKVSPDRSSDGAGRDDADSVVSFESQKSATNVGMPVLEDGLSDSECLSGDENPSSPVKAKTNGRHQSTQSDFLFDSNHQSLIHASHKRQFAKSTPTNGSETQQKSFYIRPPPPSSFVRPVTTNRTPPPTAPAPVVVPPESNVNPSKSAAEETTNAATTSAETTTLGENIPKAKNLKKKDYDTDEETDKLLGLEHRIHAKNQAVRDAAVSKPPTKSKSNEENSSVLIEGVLFRCRYLGSTQLLVEGNPTKASRMVQAQEAVGRIKAPQGETQPSVEVDLFISTEKIMVLNTDLQDILMDHSLRSISYIADIGDLVVLMAKRRYLQHADDNSNGHDDHLETPSTTRRVVSINQKMICHVFESDEAQSIAHSIGQAFQVAYVEFLKANGIDDPSYTRDIDYQEVLNQQEIGSEELDRFSKKECQKEVIVPKAKNEPLGVVIVESGWGSMLPTVVIANMMPAGPAARCGHLNIGDQIISVNGISLVGLPISSCQTQIKSMKHLTTVRLVVVPCPPVVEVLIRRPDTKYQLGFSVQNGIICSLLRGGIAERGGVRVGHRIIEINGQSVVATQHERIVSMLSNSIGELRMKTMPTQMYRLLTGQENPVYI